jgi:hypothetical protein
MPIRKRWPQECLSNRLGIASHQFYQMARRRDLEGLSVQAQCAGFDHHNAWIEQLA